MLLLGNVEATQGLKPLIWTEGPPIEQQLTMGSVALGDPWDGVDAKKTDPLSGRLLFSNNKVLYQFLSAAQTMPHGWRHVG